VLAAAQRLKRSEDFAATIRAGRRAGRGGVVVHLRVALDDTAEVRAGFVVSRAIGNAVVRNRVRRRLRHLVRDRLAALPAGADLVVRAVPAAAARSYAELGVDLDTALSAALSRGGAPNAAVPARTRRAAAPGIATDPAPGVSAARAVAATVAARPTDAGPARGGAEERR
jgi:ribonuclease P protein component